MWAGALFLVSDTLALCVDSAGIRQEAEVDTGTLNTALGCLTVPVPDTLHLAALLLGVPLETLRTEAHRTVPRHPALGSGGAARAGTGVLALASPALFLVAAVVILGTAWQAGASLAEVALGAGQVARAFLPAAA